MNINLSIVSETTTVAASILMEDAGFVALLRENATVEQLIEYVNNNF